MAYRNDTPHDHSITTGRRKSPGWKRPVWILPKFTWAFSPPGTGALGDLGSHIIDLSRYLCGAAVAVISPSGRS
jgi:predicted dehydrogenase